MMYSLINVSNESNGKVDGYWLQDCTGTLETAKERARQTEAVNSHKITVAVTTSVNHPVPMLEYWKNLVRLG